MQQLFGGVEPSTKMLAEHYKQQPEIAAYLTARHLAAVTKAPFPFKPKPRTHSLLVFAFLKANPNKR